MKEALFWEPIGDKAKCKLCPRSCVIPQGEWGTCKARKNINGALWTMVYPHAIGPNIDPIEKKPLYHFLPSSKSFSFGTAGCNLSCGWCFAPDTTIAIENSIVNIKDIFNSGRNERALRHGKIRELNNPKAITPSGKSLEILNAFQRDYEGELVIIKPYYLPTIKCTPNHKFFTYDPTSKKIVKVEASKLTSGHYLVVPKSFTIDTIKTLDVKKILYSHSARIKKVARKAVFVLDKILKLKNKLTSREIGKRFGLHPTYVRKLLSKTKKEGKERLLFDSAVLTEYNSYLKFKYEKGKGVPRFVKIDKNFGKLLGLYCAEGHVSKCKDRPNSYSLHFSFGMHEMALIKETAKLIEKIFKIKPNFVKHRTNIEVCTSKTSLALLFKKLCGSGAKNKRVPEVINKADNLVVKAFLKGYIEGDGWIDKRIISINTVSKRLAIGVCYLFLKLGLLPSFYEWRPPTKKKIESRTVKQSVLYYVKLQPKELVERFLLNKKPDYNPKGAKFLEDKEHYFVRVREVSQEYYASQVYNIEVQNEHAYLANFVAVGNCQNWQDAQSFPEQVVSVELPPDRIVEAAKSGECASIAYTYTEPAIFYEYALDTAKLAKKAEIKNVIVSNGFWNPKPLKNICKYLDGANVDLKALDDKFYRKYTGAWLEPVLKSLKILKQENVWVEVTNLVIPDLNDDFKIIEKLIDWVKENLGEDTPLHFTAFYPAYKMLDKPRTLPETLKKARKLAIEKGMKYVYTGNIQDEEGSTTYCPKCRTAVILRRGFLVIENKLKDGKCLCGEKIPGVWK